MSRAAMTDLGRHARRREHVDDGSCAPSLPSMPQPTIDRVVVHVAAFRHRQYLGGRPRRFTEGLHEGRPLGVGLDGDRHPTVVATAPVDALRGGAWATIAAGDS